MRLSNTNAELNTDGDYEVDLTANISVTGYRKPFWGWKYAADKVPTNLTGDAAENAKTIDVKTNGITGAQIRALGNSAKSVNGLPTTGSILNGSNWVPAGVQEIIFAAKKDTYKGKNIKLTNKTTSTWADFEFEKLDHTVSVPGANGAASEEYDVWFYKMAGSFSQKAKLEVTWF
jgi:hypothetical protein